MKTLIVQVLNLLAFQRMSCFRKKRDAYWQDLNRKMHGKKLCGIQRDPEKDDYIFSMTGKELLEKLKKLQKEGCDLSQKVCFVTKKNEKVEDLDLELMHVFYGEDFIELYSRGGKL